MHVTVIMSIHNNEKTLRTAVESIQKQTYKDWDMIVVDDASTDGSRELLLNVSKGDSRIQVLFNANNIGLAASLNKALSYAKGPLIARMDGDDISFPERFEKQVDFLMKNPEIDVLGTNALLMTKLREFTKNIYRELDTEHEDIVNRFYLDKHNPFIHPTIMAKKEFFVALGGYNEKYRVGQDMDLWLRGCKKFHYHNLQDTLLYYMAADCLTFNSFLAQYNIRLRAAFRDKKVLTYGWYAFRSLYYLVKKRIKRKIFK